MTVAVDEALAGGWLWLVDATEGRDPPPEIAEIVANVAEPPMKLERTGVVTLEVPSDRRWRVYVAGPNGVGWSSRSRSSARIAELEVQRTGDSTELSVVGPHSRGAAIIARRQRLPLTPQGKIWIGSNTKSVVLVAGGHQVTLPTSERLDTTLATEPIPKCLLASSAGPVAPEVGCDTFLRTLTAVEHRFGQWEESGGTWSLVRRNFVDLPEPPMDGYIWKIDGLVSFEREVWVLEPGTHSARSYRADRPVRREGDVSFVGTVTARPGVRTLEVDVRPANTEFRTIAVRDSERRPLPFAPVFVKDPLSGAMQPSRTGATGELAVPADEGVVAVGLVVSDRQYPPPLENKVVFEVSPGNTRATAPWSGADVVGQWQGQQGRPIVIESVIRLGATYALVDLQRGAGVTLGIVFSLDGGGLYIPGVGELTAQP